MSNILVFTPRHQLDIERNIQDFISFSQKLPPFNPDYDYHSNYWKGVGNFTVFGTSNQSRDPESELDATIIPFAKAYVSYGKNTKSAISNRFYAMRAINSACMLKHGFVDIGKLGADEFDKAAEVALSKLSEGAAYQAGRGLELLLDFLISNQMVKAFSWKSPIRKPADNAIGEGADARRFKKMPDENALQALAKIFSYPVDTLSCRDITTTSIMTLLMSAPARGSEPFYLRYDCLNESSMKASRAVELGLSKECVELLITRHPDFKDGVSLSTDPQVILKGISWYSGKGYGYDNKWIPTVMIDCVTAAIERLIVQSEEARSYARMLEESPSFPRHRLCPHVKEDDLLTSDQVALALGLDLSIYGENTKQLLTSKRQLLKRKGVSSQDYCMSLKDLNVIVRKSLPPSFPYVEFKTSVNINLKWSQALFARFNNQMDSRKATIYTELFMPTINTLNEDLSPTKKVNRSTGQASSHTFSVFQRWDFSDLSITSHQLRHMLDTMAAVNGMEGDIRAKWAQRSDPKHNAYYDHTTPEEYGADFIEGRENEEERKGALATVTQSSLIEVQVANPRTIQELNTKASLTAHSTEFGICIHSYMSEPCLKYKDCLNCNEHVCEKGDDGKCDRIRERLKKEKQLLKQDKKAVDELVPGAEQWYARRSLTVSRCEQLLEMLTDPGIENGALIKLKNMDDISHLDRAFDANGRKRLPEIVNYKRVNYVSMKNLIGDGDP